MDDVELPRGIALAWGVAADPQRGPKRELSVERIVDAAMGIADAEGLGAVSMSSVATRLGYTTMSLYRYVSAKDDLIQLMSDEGFGDPPDHAEIDTDWRQGLRRWSRSLAAVYAAHPWLLDIPIDGVPILPNNLSWLDWGLRLLEPAEMSAADAVAAVLMISGLTRWQSVIDRSLATAGPSEAEQIVFGQFVTAERYPALARAVASGGMSDDPADDPFRFALERALDGLERAAGSARNRPAPGALPESPDPAELIQSSGPSESTEPSDAAAASETYDYPRDARLKEATRKRRDAEATLRDAEAKLRDARRKEADLITKARERAVKARMIN